MLRKIGRSTGLIFAFALLLWGCGGGQVHDAGGSGQEKLEFTQDIGRPVFEFRLESLSLKVSAKNLAFRGLGEGQRALFEKGPDLQVADNSGKTLLHLNANSAIALFPYTEITLKEFTIQTNDGTEFEGDELVWPYKSHQNQVGMLGRVLLITDEVMLEGDTVIAQDPLLRAYQVLHVKSAMDLNLFNSDQVDSASGQ